MLKQTPYGGCVKSCPGLWPSRCKGFVWEKEAGSGENRVSNETWCRQPVQCDIWRFNGGKLGWCQVPNTQGKIVNDSFFFLPKWKNLSWSLFSQSLLQCNTHSLIHSRLDSPGSPGSPRGKWHPWKICLVSSLFCGLCGCAAARIRQNLPCL